MLTTAGYKIEDLPYKNLTKVQDILYADGPILTHYNDLKLDDFLSYWVDYNETFNRWLIFKTEKRSLYNYLSGGISLRTLIELLDSNFVFLIDEDNSGNILNVVMLNAYALPEDYLPDDRSFYTLGLPSFYDIYLVKNQYIERLRERSYIFTLEPTDEVHDRAVSSKEAGAFLIDITKSIESYIDLTAMDSLKNSIVDRAKLNKTINQLKQKVSPRIADTAYSSFQVSVAIDTVVLQPENEHIKNWKNELIEGYKNDVLDVDFTNIEDAKAIVNRFPDTESRKKIFDPLFKILCNKDISLSVTSYNKGFVRNYKRGRPTEHFKEQILPRISLEEYILAQEKRSQIVTAVFRLPQGVNLSEFKKKELIENLLFTQEGNQPTIPIQSPITVGDRLIELSVPLECTLMIDSVGNIQMFNTVLELQAEGNNMPEVIESIKRQFIDLVDFKNVNPNFIDEKTRELDKLLIKKKHE